MSNSQIRDFTHGNITKQLVTFAWPLFLSNLLQVVYNMVDMIVVGHVLGNVWLRVHRTLKANKQICAAGFIP